MPADADRVIVSSRESPHPPAAVYAAFTDPVVLARWWGPAGFTSTFDVFEPRPGGGTVFRFTLRRAGSEEEAGLGQ